MRWRDSEKAGGEHDLDQRQIAEPFEEGLVAWEPDKAPAKSLQEPSPSMDNFFNWLNTRTDEEQEPDWELPPEPDPRKPRTNEKVKFMVRMPEETSSALSVNKTISWLRFDSRANS